MTTQSGLELQLIAPDGRMTSHAADPNRDVMQVGPFVVRPQGGQWWLVALTHSGVVKQNGHAINTRQPILLSPWETIEADGYSLILRSLGVSTAQSYSVPMTPVQPLVASAAVVPAPALSVQESSGTPSGVTQTQPPTPLLRPEQVNLQIQLTLNSPKTQVVSFGSSDAKTWQLTLTNKSPYVDSFSLQVVSKLDAEVIQIQTTPPVRLYENGVAELAVTITPTEKILAGQHLLGFIVTSDRTNTANYVEGILVIPSRDNLQVGNIEGKQELKYHQTGIFSVPIYNEGNSDLQLRLTGVSKVNGAPEYQSLISFIRPNDGQMFDREFRFPLKAREALDVPFQFTPEQGKYFSLRNQHYDLRIEATYQKQGGEETLEASNTSIEERPALGLIRGLLLFLLFMLITAGTTLFLSSSLSERSDNRFFVRILIK